MLVAVIRTPAPGADAAGSSAGSGTLVAVIRTTGTGSSCGRILCPTGNQCSRIRSQARVISSVIRQLMVCSRILCRIRNAGSGDQDTGSHAAGSGRSRVQLVTG